MWMLITQLYWKDLLKLRRYGRRLVAALISHHHLVSNSQSLGENDMNTHRCHRYIITPTETYYNPSCTASRSASTPSF